MCWCNALSNRLYCPQNIDHCRMRFGFKANCKYSNRFKMTIFAYRFRCELATWYSENLLRKNVQRGCNVSLKCFNAVHFDGESQIRILFIMLPFFLSLHSNLEIFDWNGMFLLFLFFISAERSTVSYGSVTAEFIGRLPQMEATSFASSQR